MTKKAVGHDPLGLQRFALTESAYDLISSLTGVYARLRYRENKVAAPDTAKLARWSERAHALQTIHSNSGWNDLFFLERLIEDITREYKQAVEEEEASTKYAAESQSGTVHA